jgi:Ca2+-binding RTX toxin-like protein
LEELAGGGVDDLDFSFSSQAVTLNLSSTTRQIGTHGTRKLFVQTLGQAANFENLYGGFGNDNITGNVQNNIIIGGEGHDSMSGAAGDDRYIFNDPAGAQTDQIGERLNQGIDLLDFRNSTLDITVNLASNTALAMQGTRKIKMLTGFSSQYVEASFTGSGDDNIRGNNAINYIDGGAGNDFLAGGTGNDVYNFVNHTTVEQDTLSELAGGGQDTLTFQNATQAVKLDLRGTTIASYGLASIVVPTGQQANLEHVIGTDDNDILIGNNANNNLSGGTGRDVIIGGKGQDLLLGSADDDLLIGGTTSFDFTAIDEIYAEWTSNRTYTARINNIRGTTKTGLNNGKFLTSLTVSDDGTRDTLDGNLDTDWFWLGVNDLSDRVIGTELMN